MRCARADLLAAIMQSLSFVGGAQGSKGSGEVIQRGKDSSTVAEVHINNFADAAPLELPDVEAYRSLACNERIVDEGFSGMEGSNILTSSMHLAVPQNAITRSTLQVRHLTFLAATHKSLLSFWARHIQFSRDKPAHRGSSCPVPRYLVNILSCIMLCHKLVD